MKQPTAEERATLSAVAQGLTTVANRTPILETPKDYGLDYDDIQFRAEDGIELAAWFIPAEGSSKLIICNHPATFNRYGFPGHKKPWSDFQDVEVTFGKVYKALHDAGYNVLTYDLGTMGKVRHLRAITGGKGFPMSIKMSLLPLITLTPMKN